MAPAPKTRIVILGGGIGAMLAHKLSPLLDPSRHELILISNRPFFTLLIAGLRMVVTTDQSLEDKALISFDKLFAPGKPGSFKLGTVAGVSETEVLLEDGETVRYDQLVVATGNTWEGPLDFPAGAKDASVKHVDKWRGKFATARRVVLIGGGAVGLGMFTCSFLVLMLLTSYNLELAGEIKHYHPATEVTIIHSDSLPLNSAYSDKFRNTALASVTKKGVKVILNDKLDVDGPDATHGVTRKGVTIDADLIVSYPTSNLSSTVPANTIMECHRSLPVVAVPTHPSCPPSTQPFSPPPVSSRSTLDYKSLSLRERGTFTASATSSTSPNRNRSPRATATLLLSALTY